MPGHGHGVPGPEDEGFVTILTRLGQWKEQGRISPEQSAHLAGLSRGEPFSLFLELNVLLYAGVLRSLPDSAGLSALGRINSATSSL
jgi:hypothetical protein